MNLDMRVIARDGYTSLDFISDVGGMQGMLMSFAAFILGIMNYNYFDNHIVERMFRMRPPNAQIAKSKLGESFSNVKKPSGPIRMSPTLFQNLKEYGRSWLSSSMLNHNCCRQS